MTADAPTATPTSYGSDSGRARLPGESGFATASDGVRLAWDVYGTGDVTLVLLPSTPIVHSRQWKAQIHYLSRYYRVVAYDGRGNGRSDRPVIPEAYHDDRLVADIATVMDATGTREAVLVGLCFDGVWRAVRLAGESPERVRGLVAFAAGVPKLSPPLPHRLQYAFDDELSTDEGWAKVNRHYWRRDYEGFARWFFTTITSEPHSTKAIEDATGWAIDGSIDAMLAENDTSFAMTTEEVEAACRAIRCPVLVVHGTEDQCQPLSRSQRFAELIGARLVIVEGANHMIPGRHPVLANLLIRELVDSLPEVRA